MIIVDEGDESQVEEVIYVQEEVIIVDGGDDCQVEEVLFIDSPGRGDDQELEIELEVEIVQEECHSIEDFFVVEEKQIVVEEPPREERGLFIEPQIIETRLVQEDLETTGVDGGGNYFDSMIEPGQANTSGQDMDIEPVVIMEECSSGDGDQEIELGLETYGEPIESNSAIKAKEYEVEQDSELEIEIELDVQGGDTYNL